MQRLGYRAMARRAAMSARWSRRELGILKPDGLVGTHLQQIFAFPNGTPGEMEGLSPFELEGFANLDMFQKYSGYQDIQSKRPGTLGFGLVDSPSALLAWNAELFFGFEGEGEKFVDRERYLMHVSIYWFTATGSTAAENYLENARTGAGYREMPNETPTAVGVFPLRFSLGAELCQALQQHRALDRDAARRALRRFRCARPPRRGCSRLLRRPHRLRSRAGGGEFAACQTRSRCFGDRGQFHVVDVPDQVRIGADVVRKRHHLLDGRLVEPRRLHFQRCRDRVADPHPRDRGSARWR